jgi:hypothetical protein
MAGKLIVDTLQTESTFLQMNVGTTRIATMNASGIYSNTGTKMIGSDGSIGATTVDGSALVDNTVTAAKIVSVANTQITGNITSSQIAANAVTQTAIASGVAGTGPAFRAYKSAGDGNQTGYSTTTWTKVTFGAETFDTDNCFASSTFTPNVAGYYRFQSTLNQGSGSTTRCIIGLYKNGSLVSRLIDLSVTFGSNSNIGGSDIFYMNGTTDYAEIYIFQAGATGVYFSEIETYFSGELVRAA